MIYVVQADVGGPVKIGYTAGPTMRGRLRHIQNGYPYRLVVRHLSDGGVDDERTLHTDFAHLRMRGEWFQPGTALVARFPSVIPATECVLDLDGYAAARDDGRRDAHAIVEAEVEKAVGEEIKAYNRLRLLNRMHGALLRDLLMRISPEERARHAAWPLDRYAAAIVRNGGSWPGWIGRIFPGGDLGPPRAAPLDIDAVVERAFDHERSAA